MRILLTGANGQLGQRFRELCPHDVVPLSHAPGAGVDPARVLAIEDEAACARVVRDVRPDWIVHAAAMTNVDACERDPEAAAATNARGTANIARAAAAVGARLVYVSTDYVFDGEKGDYTEEDPVHPINVYGATKLEGERLAREAVPDAIIARTSVVFGPHKNNFVTWVVRELRAGKPVRVVEDQQVNPTLTSDLSLQILALIAADASGVYHTTGATSLTRLEMARMIARAFGLDESLLVPTKSAEMPWDARRPMDSTMNVTKISRIRRPMAFGDALDELKRELAARAADAPCGTARLP